MRTLITGSTGLVGSALVNQLTVMHPELFAPPSTELNLLDRSATFKYIREKKPNLIINAAGTVGGIIANMNYPSKMLSMNIQMQTNLIDAAHEYNVEKFVFIGSSCMYPRNSNQPISEEFLMAGELEPTNSAYAIAKIAGLELVKSYRAEFNHQWITVILNNVYGPNDKFDRDLGHVIPSLICKFTEALKSKSKSVTLLGDGSQIREFIYAEDAARAIAFCLNNYNEKLPINISSGEEVKIFDLARLISSKLKFEGEIMWDKSFFGGMPKKVLNSDKLISLGWSPKITLEEGIQKSIDWYFSHKL